MGVEFPANYVTFVGEICGNSYLENIEKIS